MRHDHDAGGDPEVLERKGRLRDEVWTRLEEAGVDRFPGARGRIPNFTGAEAAAEQLRATEAWRAADTVKANPDSPQWPVRQRALEDGKRVFMAVPKLADPDPFFLLDPGRIDASPRDASSIKGASRHGVQVSVEALEPGRIPVTDHDVPMDLAVTPDRSVSRDAPSDRPRGIHWHALTEEKIAAIPLLQRLRRQRDLPRED